MIVLLLASIGSEKTLAVSDLYLIFDKGNGHLRYIGILWSFFCLRIAMTKYQWSILKIIYRIAILVGLDKIKILIS